jgi:hypothetical protein
MPKSKVSNKVPSKTYFDPMVLPTESEEEFNKLIEELKVEFGTASFVVRMYIQDVANILFEIVRLRRVKVATLNRAFEAAVKQLLSQIVPNGAKGPRPILGWKLEDMAKRWRSNQKIRDRVSWMLDKAGFDESAIEAEAYRQAFKEIEGLDHLLASAEGRRDRALRMIAGYEESLAVRLQQGGARMLEANTVPSLDYRLPEN